MMPADEPLLEPFVPNLTQTIETFGLTEGDLQGDIVEESQDQTILR